VVLYKFYNYESLVGDQSDFPEEKKFPLKSY